MSVNGPEGRGGRQRPPRREVVVQQVEQLTPQLTRVVVSGDLQNWKAAIPGGHFKVFVPGGGARTAADGAAAGGAAAGGAAAGGPGDQGEEEWVIRTYTARECDPDGGLLTIDFAIHAEGPATQWAKVAKPGDKLQISGLSRPGYAPSEGSTSTLFIADQSALPAVAAITEALPAGYRARALIEIPTEAEKLELTSDAELEVEWILESDVPCERLVAAALEASDGTAADAEYWVGCEADAMRAIRRHLLHERGISPRSLYTRAYWKQSVANHPDHDTGDDVD